MLRTLPSRHFAELEELLPEALSNSTMVNGLECKLSNRSSKVCFLIPAVMCALPENSTILDVCTVMYTVHVDFAANLLGKVL